MSADQPTLDEPYRRYTQLLLRHHHLLSEGKEAAAETEVVEEEMTRLWERLAEAQRRSLSGLGSDLNWIRRGCRPPPKGRRPEEVAPQDCEALVQARAENDWHGVLHQL